MTEINEDELQAFLVASYDQLSAPQKAVMQMAATGLVGMDASTDVLRRLGLGSYADTGQGVDHTFYSFALNSVGRAMIEVVDARVRATRSVQREEQNNA